MSIDFLLLLLKQRQDQCREVYASLAFTFKRNVHKTHQNNGLGCHLKLVAVVRSAYQAAAAVDHSVSSKGLTN